MQPQKQVETFKMDVPKDDVNSQFTFTYDDIKGTVHVVDHLTGEEYDLLKEDTGWFDAEFKFDYNPDYYPRHMEALGFAKEVDWVQIRINIPQEVPAKYARVAQYVKEQMGLRVIKLSYRDLYKNGYGRKVFKLLNEAYMPIFGFSELSDEQMDNFLNRYLKLIDSQLMPFIVNDKDELVGAAITMGSLTQAMRKANGRLWPFGWYHLLKALRWKREDNAEMLLVAVRPDYQGLGVNAMFFDDLIPIYNKYGFKWAETGPQLEDNVRELTQWKPLNPEYVKRRRCYCKRLK